jgi:hypothetical protein
MESRNAHSSYLLPHPPSDHSLFSMEHHGISTASMILLAVRTVQQKELDPVIVRVDVSSPCRGCPRALAADTGLSFLDLRSPHHRIATLQAVLRFLRMQPGAAAREPASSAQDSAHPVVVVLSVDAPLTLGGTGSRLAGLFGATGAAAAAAVSSEPISLSAAVELFSHESGGRRVSPALLAAAVAATEAAAGDRLSKREYAVHFPRETSDTEYLTVETGAVRLLARATRLNDLDVLRAQLADIDTRPDAPALGVGLLALLAHRRALPPTLRGLLSRPEYALRFAQVPGTSTVLATAVMSVTLGVPLTPSRRGGASRVPLGGPCLLVGLHRDLSPVVRVFQGAAGIYDVGAALRQSDPEGPPPCFLATVALSPDVSGDDAGALANVFLDILHDIASCSAPATLSVAAPSVAAGLPAAGAASAAAPVAQHSAAAPSRLPSSPRAPMTGAWSCMGMNSTLAGVDSPRHSQILSLIGAFSELELAQVLVLRRRRPPPRLLLWTTPWTR